MNKLVELGSKLLSKAIKFGSEHTEEILAVGAGITGVAACVTAAKAAYNMADEDEEILVDIDEVKESYTVDEETGKAEYKVPVNFGDEAVADDNDYEIVEGDEATKYYKEDLWELYKERAGLYIKSFRPSVVLELMSLGAMGYGVKVAKTKQQKLAARVASCVTTIAGLQQSFGQYRKNVIDTYGKEVDRDMRLGTHREKLECTEVNEKGKEKKKKQEVELRDPSKISDRWTRCFDEASVNFSKDFMQNKYFLISAENLFNGNLRSYGYVTVNDIYKWLDVPQTEEGQTWGWVYNPDIEHQIDFGIKDITDAQKRAFINGYERCVWIDFKIPPKFIGSEVWGSDNNKMMGIANRCYIGRGCH